MNPLHIIAFRDLGVQYLAVAVEAVRLGGNRQLLSDALEKLEERERRIITMRFGLDGRPERTQKEVADQLGISQSYISRLEKRIINRLKREILKML